jgi:hypothetical protein
MINHIYHMIIYVSSEFPDNIVPLPRDYVVLHDAIYKGDRLIGANDKRLT